MKKLLCLLLALSLLMTACNNNRDSGSNVDFPSPTPVSDMADTSDQDTAADIAETTEPAEDRSIGVNKGSEEVTISLGASWFAGENPDDVIAEAEAGGISAVRNEDGSFTYTMSEADHTVIMDGMSEDFNASIDEMTTDGTYPSLTAIRHNQDFTQFDVVVNREEYENSAMDSIAVMALGYQGMFYQVFNGTPESKITINILDAESETVFNTIVYPDDLNE